MLLMLLSRRLILGDGISSGRRTAHVVILHITILFFLICYLIEGILGFLS